jgi:hypothetical protein
VAWRERQYAPWLLEHEERLVKRRELSTRIVIGLGLAVAVLEALWRWENYTPDIPPWLHIAVAALILPVLYFMLQSDYRRKLQAFTREMSDLERRLFVLDPYLEPEQFEVMVRMHGALLLPTQRALDKALRAGGSRSLRRRIDYYFRALPSPVCEGDRMGLLSVLHPKTAISWGVTIALIWLLMPGAGLQLGTSNGLTWLGLLLPVYLISTHLNARYAYELALFNWLRLG